MFSFRLFHKVFHFIIVCFWNRENKRYSAENFNCKNSSARIFVYKIMNYFMIFLGVTLLDSLWPGWSCSFVVGCAVQFSSCCSVQFIHLVGGNPGHGFYMCWKVCPLHYNIIHNYVTCFAIFYGDKGFLCCHF